MTSMRWAAAATAPVLLLLVLGPWEASGQAAGGAAAQVSGATQLQATATEAAKAAAAGDKNTVVLLHGQKQATNMLRSMLMANSQQMFAINSLQKEVAKMRKRLDRHEEEVFKCKKQLDEYESSQSQLATDAVLADTIEPPMDFIQLHLDTLRRSSEEQVAQLHALLGATKAQFGREASAGSVGSGAGARATAPPAASAPGLEAGASFLQRRHRRHRLRSQRLPDPDPGLEYDEQKGTIVHKGGPTEAEKRQMLEQATKNPTVAMATSGSAAAVVADDSRQGAPADAPNWESPEDHDTGMNDAMYDFTGSTYQIIKKSENTPEKIAERNLMEVNRLAEEKAHKDNDTDDEEDNIPPEEQ